MGCSSSKSTAGESNHDIKAAVLNERCANEMTRRKSNSMLHNLVHEEFRRNISEVYDLSTGRPLGAGSFGTVRAVTHKNSGKDFALKTVEVKGIKDAAQFNVFMNEVEIMKRLDHPSVARLQEVYHSPDYVFMVMDLYSGGDLVDRQRIHTENDVINVVRDIVDGIRYCHDHFIAHRDLKLENILYEHKGPDSGIKIVDFGLGTANVEVQLLRDIVGTWVYMSPELIKGTPHSPFPVDMWSIGVITYTLMVGRFPFMADSLQMLQYKIQFQPFDLVSGPWQEVSDECKDFITKLLVKDPARRMTAQDAQLHPWISRKGNGVYFQPLADDVTQRLKEFKNQSILKRLALEIVARTLEPDQISRLEGQFRKADKTGCGELDIDTFRSVMRESALLRDKDIDQIFDSLDVSGTGKVHFSDFLAAGLKWKKLDERRLRLAFDRLDTNNCGFITLENLQFTVGTGMSEQQIKDAIKDFDHDNDGKIGFEEFCNGMRASGADLGVLSIATITSRSMTAMSRMVSNTTLSRLAAGMDPDGDEAPEDDDGSTSRDLRKRRQSDVNSSDARRPSLSDRPLGDSEVDLCVDPRLQAAANSIFLRRATSETGKDLNTSLHGRNAASKTWVQKQLDAARAQAKALKEQNDKDFASNGKLPTILDSSIH